jgi:hypothetical protein
MPKVVLEGSAYLIDEQNGLKGSCLDDDDDHDHDHGVDDDYRCHHMPVKCKEPHSSI